MRPPARTTSTLGVGAELGSGTTCTGTKVAAAASRCCKVASPGVEAGLGEAVPGAEGPDGQAAFLPLVNPAAPLLFFARIARFALGHENALLSEALHHGGQERDSPDGHDSFAAARNESLRHATGQWVLWLDADEYFDDANRDKLRALLADLPDDNSAYVMKQRSAARNGSATLVDQVRLFRNHPAIRWDYRVHEQILPA